MQLNAAMRERDRKDFDRTERAKQNPNRRDAADPLDHRLESPLGRLRESGQISEAEYKAGIDWRDVFFTYLRSIGGPYPFAKAIDFDGPPITGMPAEMSDDECERAAKNYFKGIEILGNLPKRVFHAVMALAAYGEDWGDLSYVATIAQLGLKELPQKY